MNKYKLRILLVLLLFVLACLLFVCLRLESENPAEQGKNPVTTTDSFGETTDAPSVVTTTGSTLETTAETTLETTEETTQATTEATTEATTVPETTESENLSVGEKAAELAAQQVGKPYKYGTAGPDEFDASGLLYYCFAQQGISVPRSTSGQAGFGYVVEKEDIKPGDALFFWSSNPGEPEFVVIYIGNGKGVAALNSTRPVDEVNISSTYYTEHYVYARRFY